MRHRDRGEAPDASGRTPAAGAGLLAGLPLTASPSRRKRQARVAVLAVALVVALGLAATGALAATHQLTWLRPAADGRPTPRATASSARAAARPAATRNNPASAVTVSPGSASVSTVVPSAGSGLSQPVIIETVAGPPASSPGSSPQPPPSPADSLSASEQQLVNMLNPGILDNCQSRPSSEGGYILAAVNCGYTPTGPTLRPLAELIAAGSATAWFQYHTSGFTNTSHCPIGGYLGTWYHGTSVGGQLGCEIEANGLLRIVWVVGGEVGLIAEGSDPQALWSWFHGYGCLVLGTC